MVDQVEPAKEEELDEMLETSGKGEMNRLIMLVLVIVSEDTVEDLSIDQRRQQDIDGVVDSHERNEELE